ncbi:MAG: PD40 domain-containing protein, partial [Bacteroidetes bacterium]|nr:PD40 domain-containing protein [Fibrella sp.]
MRFRPHLLVVLMAITATGVRGQTPADADIYLVDFSWRQPVMVGKPVNITQRKGYDNQPSFTPDGKSLLFTSIREDGQADSYRYNLRQRTTTQLTRTPESEYSPVVTPDRTHFSVIRVEKDQTQRLWKFPLSSGKGEPMLVLEKVKPVGYHCWLSADSLALFVLGTPNTLQLVRVSTGDTVRVEESIGRSLHRIPGKNAVSFVHKRTPTDWEINQLDLQTRRITLIARALEGSED